jgi:sortase (surface protein transpeptidase)
MFSSITASLYNNINSSKKSSFISKEVQHKGEVCHEEYHHDNHHQDNNDNNNNNNNAAAAAAAAVKQQQQQQQLEVVLPVLIIPGIMSSGLEVIKSSVNDKHIGERVWLNVSVKRFSFVVVVVFVLLPRR